MGAPFARGRSSPIQPGDIHMDQPTDQPSSESPKPSTYDRSSADAPRSGVTHPVLSRLLEEVRNAKRVEAAYDRVHNRHNRGQ